MRGIADNHRLFSRFSRFVSRCLRVGAGMIAGSRVAAALAAALVIVGAQTTVRFERLGATETSLVASVSTPMSAWHPVASHRIGAAVRSLSRLPAHGDAALPEFPHGEARHSVAVQAVAIGANEPVRPSVASRGYDATAPPALS